MSSAMFSYRQTVYDSEMASLCNVKYLLSHNPSLDVDGFTLLKQFGQIYLYKNENTSSIGKFFTQAITQDTVTYGLSSEVFDKDRFLTETLIIENEDVSFDEDEEGSEKEAAFQVASENLLSNYTLEKLTYKVKNQTFEGQDTVTIPIDSHALADSGYDRIYVDFTLILDDPSVSYITLNDSYQYYVSTSTDDPKVHVRLRLPASCQEITITNSDQSPLSGSVKKIRFYGSKGTLSESDQAVVSFDTPVRDTLVTGTVENKADGILMVSIPYEDGWTAYVDGEETTIHCVDYGFCGLELTAGSHEITLRYRAPGLMAGFFLSLMGWCIFVAGLLLRRRTRKKMR
jgi:uncharacterized membrane protein YfhO